MIDGIEIAEIKKILIVQTAFLGDVILITPLIRAAKLVFVRSKIDVLVIPEYRDVLKGNPSIKEIISFNKRNKKLYSFIKVLTYIRNKKYDLAISPHSSLTTALLLYMSGIKYRVGFRRWVSQYFFNIKVEHQNGVLKIVKNLKLLLPFSKEKFSIETELFPTKALREDVQTPIDVLKKKFTKLIAIAPGSVWKTKRWPIENYKLLIEKLVSTNYGIVFIGSNEEKKLCKQIYPDRNYVDFSGRLSVLDSAAVIKECDLLICNDSGAMHIANAVRTDVIAIFGPTTENIGYFPYRKNDFVFQNELECRPCSSHGTNVCKMHHHNCMKLTTPDLVFHKVIEKFK